MSGYRQRRKVWKDLTRTLHLLAGDTPTTVGAAFLVGRPKYTIYVQKIAGAVLTLAAQTLTFQDTAGTPLRIGVLPASAPVGPFVLFELEEGIPLGEGNSLDIVGAAGVAADIYVQAYLRPTGTMVPSQV